MSLRSFAVSFRARRLPPTSPPFLPRATARGSFIRGSCSGSMLELPWVMGRAYTLKHGEHKHSMTTTEAWKQREETAARLVPESGFDWYRLSVACSCWQHPLVARLDEWPCRWPTVTLHVKNLGVLRYVDELLPPEWASGLLALDA